MSISNIRRRLTRGDDGFSLTEVIVAMGLFSVLLAVMMAAVIQWAGGAARTAKAADLATESGIVFDTFDKTVLSASDINRPVKVAGDWYVEVLDTTVMPQKCTQWVLRADGRMQMRSWNSPISGTILAPAWTTRGTRFVSPSTPQPFVMNPVSSTSDRQSVSVTLSGKSGSKSPVVKTTGTFVARNSTDKSVTNPDSAPHDGRSDSEVCTTDFSNVPGGRA